MKVSGNVPSDGGVGVMQLTPPSSDEQVWDWQANVNAGIGVFDNKLLAAIAHEETDQSTVQNMLNALVAAGKPYTSVEMDYTPDMLVQDAVQAYNGYFAWQPSTNLSDYYPVNGKVTVKWVTTQYAGLYEKPVLATTTDPLVATTQPPAWVTAGHSLRTGRHRRERRREREHFVQWERDRRLDRLRRKLGDPGRHGDGDGRQRRGRVLRVDIGSGRFLCPLGQQ